LLGCLSAAGRDSNRKLELEQVPDQPQGPNVIKNFTAVIYFFVIS
jgi:hypothetical protein